MNIVVGASGRVGSAVIDHFIQKEIPVRGVVRNPQKAATLKKKGAHVVVANLFDLPSLQKAFAGGHTVFVLTPENIHTEDVIGDAQKILTNYRHAIQSSSVQKIIGLSSIGAQHATGTGNLKVSYMLEQAFKGLSAQQIFIRPAYYYSNWLGYLPSIKQTRVLPTFYPENLPISMISPQEVSRFVAKTMNRPIEGNAIYELEGPCYSSNDIAKLLGEQMNIPVKARQIPKRHWEKTLQQIGFSTDATDNFIVMIEAVIDGRTKPGHGKAIQIQAQVTFNQYIANHPALLKHPNAMKTTNYFNTFIEVAPDCPVKTAEIPPERANKTAVRIQYEMLADNPYVYNSDDVIFNVHATKNEIPQEQKDEERTKFFSKGRPCLRSSALGKRYGWGVHSNASGKVAIYAVESDEYKRLASDDNLDHLTAMRSSRS